MRSCGFQLVRVLGRVALASACAIFIFKGATQLSTRPPPYAFESTATGSNELTKWPACSTIYYSVDMSNAPKNAAAVLARDTGRAHQITGLAFRRIDIGTPPNFTSYDASGSIAPVIFAWVGADQLFGQKNVNAVTVPIVDSTRAHYTSGIVLFNDAMNATFQTDQEFANNLMLHELGHVLGLSDVSDPAQVMNYFLQPNTTVDAYAGGDVAGLRKLYPPVCQPASVVRGTINLGAGSPSRLSGITYRTALPKGKQWG